MTRMSPRQCLRSPLIWLIPLGLVGVVGMVFVFNLMAHALWLSGHPVEGTGASGEAWGRRADAWFAVLVVILGLEAWCVWRVVRVVRRRGEAIRC